MNIGKFIPAHRFIGDDGCWHWKAAYYLIKGPLIITANAAAVIVCTSSPLPPINRAAATPPVEGAGVSAPAPVESGGWGFRSPDTGSIFYYPPISISSGGGSGGSESGGSGTTPIPEPTTLIVLASGLGVLALLRPRIRRPKAAAPGGPQA